MTIGHVITEYYGEDNKRHLRMVIRPPMMESGTFSVHPNTQKEKENEPDFNIWFNYNRKGEKFPSTKVGALWNKVSDRTGNKYKDGYIETPSAMGGKLYIAVVDAKAKEGESALPYSHNVLWSPPRSNSGGGEYANDGGYAAPAPRHIPVTMQNAQGETTGTGSMERAPMPENDMPPIDIPEDEILF